jgi:hypothetical protein
MSLVEAADMGKADARDGRPYATSMPVSGWTEDQKVFYRDGWILAAHSEIIRLRAVVKMLEGS